MTKIGLMIFSTGIGGAEKRYLNIYQNFRKTNDLSYRIVLIINKRLFQAYKNANLLCNLDECIIIDEPILFNYINHNNVKLLEKINTLISRIYQLVNIYSYRKEIESFDVLQFVLDSVRFIPIVRNMNLKALHIISLVHSTYDPLNNKSFTNSLPFIDIIDCLSPNVAIVTKDILKKTEVFVTSSPNSFTNCTYFQQGSIKADRVVFVSRMEKIKNPKMFLEIASLFHSNFPYCKIPFSIAGTGSLEDEIRERVYEMKRNGVNIEYLGFLPDPTSLLRESLIFIQTQTIDDVGSQALLEAMGQECIVISPSIPGSERIIPPNCGFLVMPSAEAFCKALMTIFENKNKYISLGVNARKFVLENFSFEKYKEYLLFLYLKRIDKLIIHHKNRTLLFHAKAYFNALFKR